MARERDEKTLDAPSTGVRAMQYGSMGDMKTTIEISDALLEEVKRTAAAEETSLREFVEEALRRILSERREQEDFRLRRASFKGRGLRPDVSEGNWEQLRDLAYQGRGS